VQRPAGEVWQVFPKAALHTHTRVLHAFMANPALGGGCTPIPDRACAAARGPAMSHGTRATNDESFDCAQDERRMTNDEHG